MINKDSLNSDKDDSSIVIIGAHQDSVNQWFPWGRSPGADDDGINIMLYLFFFISPFFSICVLLTSPENRFICNTTLHYVLFHPF